MKGKRWIGLLLALCLLISCVPKVQASSELLFTQYGFCVYSDTTIDQIRSMYGTEKLVTDSIFGGKTYTFYGDNYSKYLFLETNAEGKITSYVIFGDDFQSQAGNAGDPEVNECWYLSGERFVDYRNDYKTWAVTGYCSQNVADAQAVFDRYNSDAIYAMNILRHAVPMYTAMSIYSGHPQYPVFNEEAFYINRQLMENDSSLYEYAESIQQEAQVHLFSESWLTFLLSNWAIMPNPAGIAANARHRIVADGSYLLYDVLCEQQHEFMGALDPEFFNAYKKIPYTDAEKELLRQARERYAHGVELYNSVENVYEVEPQYQQMPLEPGKISEAKLQGATEFLNAIRVAAGMPALEYSPVLCEGSQCKAALVTHITYNKIPCDSLHKPPQLEGISDEFYAKAQCGGGENLYHGNLLTSICNALDDSDGDPVLCRHRSALLMPYFKEFGIGLVVGQAVQKLDGVQDDPYMDVRAWPSKGVALVESFARPQFHHCIWFQNGLSPTQDTSVRIHCLNTDEIVEIPAGANDTMKEFIAENDTGLTYYSNRIALHPGCVYEFTFTNLHNVSTDQLEDYTYRSVVETAYVDTATEVNEVRLDQTELKVEIDGRAKICAEIFPADAANKRLHWKSDNEAIAVVNQNGYVTGLQNGTAVITAETDNGVTAQCTVTVCSHIHSFSPWQVTEEATCQQPGKEMRYCYDCGREEFREIPKIDHHYEKTVIKPTCTEKGYTIYTCSMCKDQYQADYVPANGHTWDGWNTVQEADCFHDGLQQRTCRYCGASETQAIPANSEHCPSRQFQDLVPGKWYHRSIDYMLSKKYMVGVSETEFGVSEELSRGQLAAILYRIAGRPDVTGMQHPFTDVGQTYYTNAVIWAYNEGYIYGTTKTTYEPNTSITRVQLVKILYRYDGADKMEENLLEGFADADRIPGYAVEAMNWAVARHIISGIRSEEGLLLAPHENATRAQIAGILANYLTK